MLLKTLSLAGFKSFADRTRLEFDSGVNVVVGPNGSGKSNLLDALAWVMGTQATRQLRTEKMEDVIFAGTATRPKLPRAEVTLTFDNRDGFLPLDLAEVSMTRRLYRDGTSEYELNGTHCRLLDLHELLSDGGVGRHQHVLVGQGQIGEILNARPDEHRAVIEEAAGITKHRSRRDRSVRRLEQTAADMERLTDILAEHKKRLRPLKRQANAAMRYDGVRAEVRALRLWLSGEALRAIRQRIAEADHARAGLDQRIASEQGELERLASSLGELRSAAGAVGLQLERDTAAAARLETAVERFQRISMVARERRVSLVGQLEGAGDRMRDLQAEQQAIAIELEKAGVEEHAARSLADRRELTLQQFEDEERSLAEQIQLPAEGLLANLRGDLRSLQAAVQRDDRERAQLDQRNAVVRARLEEEEKNSAELDAEIRSTDSAVVAAQETYDARRATRASVQAAWEAAEAEHQDAQLVLARESARLEAVEAVAAGLGDPSARDKALATDGVLGPVVARLDVPPELTDAVDAALGRWSDALVADTGERLASSAGRLKAEGLGGVSFVIRQRGAGSGKAKEVAAAWGVDALVDLLGPKADSVVAERLFGDVVVVEGWTAGWQLVQRHPHIRAVTPEGDWISIHGMRLAVPDGAGPAALEAAGVAVEVASRQAARAESIYTSAYRDFEQARDAERESLETLEQLEAGLAGHTEALAIADRMRVEAQAELTRIEARLHALEDAGAARADRINELQSRLADLEGEERVRQQAFEALTRRREEVAARRDDARRLREEATSALAGVLERRRLLESRRDAVQRELGDISDQEVDPAEIERLAGVEERARSAVEIIRAHIEELRRRQRELRDRAGAADGRLAVAQQRQSELDRSISSAKDDAAALAIELAELRVRDEATTEGLRRDADASESEALAAPKPDVESDELSELLATREAELRRMGPINPLAAAEYEDLAAEVELLETQLADLEESAAELRKVIAALDREMAGMFQQAFDDIAGFYEENFGLVFPGGRGRLRLTEPSRPLETGVEIDAQPLGKKVGRLSLLSGGERSLAALAFLFAVFRARPSPFYVLDEVEAALDDANLRRFLRLVATLRESAQLVIITHQQQTMEAADILYGVTMEPGESSKVIAKRLDRISL